MHLPAAPSVRHPLKDLYRYRSTALLLEVRNMTLTAAEVLAAADIFSSAELQTKNTTGSDGTAEEGQSAYEREPRS